MKVAEVMQNNDNVTIIEFEVYAVWYKSAPAYRIYVDNELMTERTFLGKEYEFYRERVCVKLDPGKHTFIFEKLPTQSVEDRLSIKNFKVNKTPTTLVENQFTIPA